MSERKQVGVQSVENGLDLILIMAHNRRPMKISDIAEQAGIAASKAHRYLVSFVRSGFITQDSETGLYGMGPVALEFSLSCLATNEPITLATREAARLSAELGHTVAVSVWGSFGPTVVRWEQPARPLMVNVGLGSVFPMYRSATGRVFAAFLQPEPMTSYRNAQGKREQPMESGETIAQVHERGMARATGDFLEGMSAFAAPVFDDRGRLVLCMTVLAYKAGFDQRWNGAVATALRETASQLSRTLGYQHERLKNL